jgi:hypothetical protein
MYQYSEINVMHFLFSWLRIKGLYMFRALFSHPQEVLYKRHLVYCVRVISVGCTRIGVERKQTTDITRTQYTKCRLYNASWGWENNARNMERPLILNKSNKECIMLVPPYWYTMIHDQQSIKYGKSTILWPLGKTYYQGFSSHFSNPLLPNCRLLPPTEAMAPSQH